MFTPSQQELLAAPLDRANVQTRSQSNRNFSYLEGWHVIAEANRIFGFDGWQRETLHCQCVSERERSIGSGVDPRGGRSGWGVTYTAKARIQVGEIIREGSGAGHGIDMDLGQAHESAIKEAETDAMKRALMTFGNQFGLALYDKQQRQVAAKPTPRSPRTIGTTSNTSGPIARPIANPYQQPESQRPEALPVTTPLARQVVTSVARPVAIPRRANPTGNEGQRATERELLAAELKELITQAKKLPADGLLTVATLFREKYSITADIPITTIISSKEHLNDLRIFINQAK